VDSKQWKENAQRMNAKRAVYGIIGMTHLSQISRPNQRHGKRLRIGENGVNGLYM